MDIIAKDAVAQLTRELVDGKAVIFRRLLNSHEAKTELKEVFAKEAEDMAGLSLPTLLRYDEWRDGAWVMKLASGYMSVYDVLTNNPGALCSPEAVLKVARQLVNHLDYLHRHGHFMVQISPHNVLVNPSTLQVKVMAPLSAYTNLSTNIFTRQKGVAPEVEADMLAANNRSDLFSLATVLQAMQRFSPLPYPLREAYSLCSDPVPAQRPGNCTEVLRLMDEACRRSKYMPYAFGFMLFAAVGGMFLYSIITDRGDVKPPKFIQPEKREPSPEGVPDSINAIIEQYQRYLQDSVLGDDELDPLLPE